MSWCVQGHAGPENSISTLTLASDMVSCLCVCVCVFLFWMCVCVCMCRGALKPALLCCKGWHWNHEFKVICQFERASCSPLCPSVCACVPRLLTLSSGCVDTLGVDENGAHRFPWVSPSPTPHNLSPCVLAHAHTHTHTRTHNWVLLEHLANEVSLCSIQWSCWGMRREQF